MKTRYKEEPRHFSRRPSGRFHGTVNVGYGDTRSLMKHNKVERFHSGDMADTNVPIRRGRPWLFSDGEEVSRQNKFKFSNRYKTEKELTKWIGQKEEEQSRDCLAHEQEEY